MYKKQQEVKVYLYRTQTEEQKTGEAWERGYYYVAIKYAIKDGSKFMLRHGPNPSRPRPWASARPPPLSVIMTFFLKIVIWTCMGEPP